MAPSMMPPPDPDSLATFEELAAELAQRAPVVRAQMFGMPSLRRIGGKHFASIWGEDLVVKLVDPQAREAALALEGAHLFAPMPGREMREWVQVPTVHRQAWADLVPQAEAGLG